MSLSKMTFVLLLAAILIVIVMGFRATSQAIATDSCYSPSSKEKTRDKQEACRGQENSRNEGTHPAYL